MVWEANSKVSRNEAQTHIQKMAQDEGIHGAFKVFYNGNIVATPNDLPEEVDLDKIEVSAVLDQA